MTTALTPITPVGPYPTLQPTATSLDITFTAGDPAGDTFVPTGRELLLVKNVHATLAKTFTVASAVDDENRSGDITNYSLAAGLVAAFWFSQQLGWRGSNGLVTVTPQDANITFAVIRLP